MYIRVSPLQLINPCTFIHTVHLAGLLLPINYHLLLIFVHGFTQYHGAWIVSTLTWGWVIVDLLRVYVPFINRNFPLQNIAREAELHSLSGVTYFMIGNWMAIVFFPPRIAICALLFMVLGYKYMRLYFGYLWCCPFRGYDRCIIWNIFWKNQDWTQVIGRNSGNV